MTLTLTSTQIALLIAVIICEIGFNRKEPFLYHVIWIGLYLLMSIPLCMLLNYLF